MINFNNFGIDWGGEFFEDITMDFFGLIIL